MNANGHLSYLVTWQVTNRRTLAGIRFAPDYAEARAGAERVAQDEGWLVVSVERQSS